MKFSFSFKKWSVLCLTLSGCLTQAQAVTLSITPPVTSNTYSGVVTLNVTGLTNSETISIQTFLDLNTNGSVDPGEPFIDVFKITDNDNSNAIIGGITNVNVPFDSNPAAGAITTSLSFNPIVVLENAVGQHLFRVVSPTGRFSPVTAALTVTNVPLAQSVSGVVYSNGVAPFPYAVVVAQDQQANNPVGATVADSNGHFLLGVPPGTYSLIAAAPNYYYDSSITPAVVLTNGTSVTNNLFLTNGTAAISGNVYEGGNSNGIGAVLLTLQSSSRFAIAFTDTNGNYSAVVSPSFWKIKAAKERLARRGYVTPSATFQVDATGGNVTNGNLSLLRGNALFYGRVTDNSNVPVVNIELDGGSNGGSGGYDAKGFSDQNGYYAVAVLGDQTNYWSCNVNGGKNAALGSYIFNTFNSQTLSTNQTVQENFIALVANARISGRVQNNSGNPVVGVALSGNAMINGNNYQSVNSTTDSSGNYSLAVANGQWNVQFLVGGFSDNLDTHGYADYSSPHVVNIPPTNAVLNLTVYPIGTPLLTAARRFTSTQFGFTINGLTNITYTVQVSSNLSSTNWASLFSLILTNNSFPVVDNQATNSPRYYRVLKN